MILVSALKDILGGTPRAQCDLHDVQDRNYGSRGQRLPLSLARHQIGEGKRQRRRNPQAPLRRGAGVGAA
jgi:hypothetical protein